MDQQDKVKVVVPEADNNVSHSSIDAPPPAYAAVAPETAAAPLQQESAPAYADHGASSHAPTSAHAHALLAHPIPAVVRAYSYWSHFKTINVCGATEKDLLFLVGYHTGYSGKPPLGTRPGLLLRNGTRKDDAVVAAAGEISTSAARAYAFELESIVLMPPLSESAAVLPPSQTQAGGFVTERMRARVHGEQVTFSFGIEVGQIGEKMRREEFVWRRVNESGEGGDGGATSTKEGDFKLTRRAPQSSSTPASSSSAPASFSPMITDKGETLALLEWPKRTWHRNHLMTLLFVGNGLSDTLGERWKLMVVMTALRLMILKTKGRTTKGFVKVGQKVHSSVGKSGGQG